MAKHARGIPLSLSLSLAHSMPLSEYIQTPKPTSWNFLNCKLDIKMLTGLTVR